MERSQESVEQIEGEFDEFGRSQELLNWRPIVDPSGLKAHELEIVHELLRRGDITWFLHPEQIKLLNWINDRKSEVSVICMSRQFGKTTMLLAYCFSYCIAHPNSTVLFVAPTKTQLGNYMQAKFHLLMQYFPPDIMPRRSGLSWIFPNGSIFRLDGVNFGTAKHLRGDAVHLCVMDEVRDMNDLQSIVESHISPMFTTTGGRLVMISTPPESPLHAFTDKYIRDAIQTGDFYTATYKANPLLSTKRLRYLLNVLHPGGESNVTFRREYLADYTVADEEKRVIKEWDAKIRSNNDEFFASYEGPPSPCRAYVAMDYAHNDPCGLLFAIYDHMAGCIIIEDEFMQRGLNTDETARIILDYERKLKAKYPGSIEPVRIMDVDPAMMHDLYSRYGLRFEPAHKVPSTVTMLNRLRVAILEGRIRIRQECVNLRFQLQAGVFNESGKDYVRTDKGGHLDLVDALCYLNLNARWREVMVPEEQKLTTNQMYIGPFRQVGTFRQGMMQRPR